MVDVQTRPPTLELRVLHPGDEKIYFALFAEVRARELRVEALEAGERLALLRSQFDAQRRGYREQFPDAHECLVVRDEVPIGWVIVDRSGRALHGIDIGFLPAEQGKGSGTAIIRALQDEAAAAGRPMVISVQRFNTRALALYNRLGFRQTAETAVHVMMTWDR